MLKRISWQAIFTTTTTTNVDAQGGKMDATKDASGRASLDHSRRASTSISVARQSVDFLLSTSTSTSTTTTASSSNPNVARSLPSRSSPPPSYLLDDDPFANLTPMTVGTRHRASSSVASTSSGIPRRHRPPPIHPELVPGLSLPAVPVGLQTPKSRLQETIDTLADSEGDKLKRVRSQDGDQEMKEKKEESKRKRPKTFFVTMSAPVSPSKAFFASKVPVPPLPIDSSVSLPASPKPPSLGAAQTPAARPFATARMQPRPAHQRPAFAARPSLPSLDTLTKTNIVLANKVRKGHVGAGLPFEPWDNLPEDEEQTGTAHFSSAMPETLPIPTYSETPWPDSEIDRTPTPTPGSAAPGSPTRSTSSSARSSAIPTTASLLATPPPRSLPLNQTVAIGPSVEHTELSWSPPLHEIFRGDMPVSLSPSSSSNIIELVAPVAVLPSVPESSVLEKLEAGNDVFHGSNSDRNAMQATDEENGYFTGDLLDSYCMSRTPEPEPDDHDSQPHWTNHQRANEERTLRWSVATYDSSADSRPQSPNSYSGSDLSSRPSYHPSYYGLSNRDSMTDVSQDWSSSRSISSTSISTSSIESNLNSSRFRSQSANISQRADVSQSIYDRLSSRSSTLIVSASDSGKNSILDSPEDPSFLSQQPYLPDVLFGPALQKRTIVSSDDSATDLQVDQAHIQVDSSSSEHAQETTTSQRNSHALAHDVSRAATANDLLPTDSTASPHPDTSSLLRTEDSQLVDYSVDYSATLCDQRSSLSARSPQPILTETACCQSPLSTLDLNDHLHLKPEPDNLQEMNGDDKRLREKVTYSRERDQHYFQTPPAALSNYSPASPRRDSKSVGEEEQRRRLILLQMRRDHRSSSQTREVDKRVLMSTAVPSALGATSVSRSPSKTAVTAPSNPQSYPSGMSTSDEEEQNSVSSDDDVPLAQRIPGALTVQQSIRKQVRAEREARRAEKAKRQVKGQPTLRPVGAGLGGELAKKGFASPSGTMLHPATFSSSPTVVNALAGTSPLRQRAGSVHQPQRSQVMHLTPPTDFHQAFKPEDLARKLQNVKITGETSSPNTSPNIRLQHSQTLGSKLSRSVSGHSKPFRPSLDIPRFAASAGVSPAPRLEPKRSFHASEGERQSRDPVVSQSPLPLHKRSMSVGRGDKETASRRGREDTAPPLPNTALQGRTSLDDRGRRVLLKPQVDSKVTTSYDLERLQQNAQGTPAGGVEGVGGGSSKDRVFIHSLQHPHVVDIRTDTSAGDLIGSLETEGVLAGWAGLGGWVIWEVAQDFGMQRPVRSYELLSDVKASWMKDKTVNYFLLKKSSLSSQLDPSTIPSSAPSHSGWVDWEAKRGKWSKRWLHLKENCLYISKKDGRDEALLCSLSNFDAYYVTRSHRAPKPFAFTVKSTDKLSLFENTADYMHTFACSEKNGEVWVEKILLARSYVLRQERAALFHSKNAHSNNNNNNREAPNLAGAALSRSGTKKATGAAKPLVDLSPGDIFAPGSLLSKQQ